MSNFYDRNFKTSFLDFWQNFEEILVKHIFVCYGKPELPLSQQLNLEFFVDASLFGMPQGFEKYMKLTPTLEKKMWILNLQLEDILIFWTSV